MVDSPDKLSTICLTKFATLLKNDENLWKKNIEERVNEYHHEETLKSKTRERSKRKSFQNEDDHSIEICNNKTNVLLQNEYIFLEDFLRSQCPLNSVLSERLAHYLVRQNQLNDFTSCLFSSGLTCLKRLTLNMKYLSRLKCDIVSKQTHLTELELIFKDGNHNRDNNLFYQHICPSIESSFEDIYSVYGPLMIEKLREKSGSTIHTSPNRLLNYLDGFSHQKLFQTIFNNLHPINIRRLKILKLVNFKFFANCQLTATRKNALIDMSPLTKCSTSNSALTTNGLSSSVPANFRLLLKLTNLISLNLSSTDIKNQCLDLIVDSMTHLEILDLSSCRSLTSFRPLLKLASKLKALNLYNCTFHLQRSPTIYQILYQLEHLEFLDISNDTTNQITLASSDYDINKFLVEVDCLPSLRYFDISGQKAVQSNSLREFLLRHKQLQFLGLFLTTEKYKNCLFDSTDPCYSKTRHYTCDLQDFIGGTISIDEDISIYEAFLIESLKRYNDRPGFVQKIIYYIFFLTRPTSSKNQMLLLELILNTMSIHTNLPSVQMASTACIYNLTRTPLTEQINVRSLAKIVRSIIHVMELFPNQQQLQKNCLLTLCSDRILHDPQFDFYRLAVLVMNNLQNYTDLAIIQPGVAILALLTTRLTIDECTKLSSNTNLQRLLQLIEQQIDRLQTMQLVGQQQQQAPQQNPGQQQEFNELDLLSTNQSQLTGDDTLRFCLSLLWNLTDENPIVCQRFIHSMGLHLFQRLINLFASDSIVLTKIVGLLSNISEVAHLRIYLYSIDIIPLMRRFLNESTLDIAFSAAGILAHLLYEQIDQQVDKELCQQMREAISKWQNPETNMVTYRSFKPFVPLLNCIQIPVVQLWAAWAIHHVFSTDRARYHRVIRDEKIYDLIKKLLDDHLMSNEQDFQFVQLLISILQSLKPFHSCR